MEPELTAALQRIAELENNITLCVADAQRVRQHAQQLVRVQYQLREELFQMQRRLDNYALCNTQLARQVYPPTPQTVYPEHEVLTIDFQQ
jgi:regulator of replication initiation timing